MYFREYLEQLKRHGLLVEVAAEVDWKLEAAAIIAMIYRLEGPAVHFKKIKGYPERYSLVGAPYSGTRKKPWQKMAVALGLSPEISRAEWEEEFTRRLAQPLKPVVVPTGPCKEEIHTGDEVDIFEFPLPYIHLGDAGRYGGTLPVTITRHPDRDWQNCGNYRWMAHTKNALGGDFQPGQHMADMYFEYERRGKPMPFCIALGVSPCLDLAAAVPLPVGVNEIDVAGGLQGEPLELVKAETNDLLVPAHAEVIIEGEVRPCERWAEGPFGEYDGFMVKRRLQPVYRVLAITHRKEPILPMAPEGFRFNDTASMSSAILAPVLGRALRALGFQETTFYSVPEACWGWPIIATPVPDEGYLGTLISAAWSIPFMAWMDKLMLVDPEVNVADTAEVLEELITRARADRVYQSKPNKPMPMVEAWATYEELLGGLGLCLNYDCTTHPGEEKPERINFETLCPKELREWAAEVLTEVIGGKG